MGEGLDANKRHDGINLKDHTTHITITENLTNAGSGVYVMR